VQRYAPQLIGSGVWARGALARIRRGRVAQADRRHRRDLVAVLERAGVNRRLNSRELQEALDAVAQARPPAPQITRSPTRSTRGSALALRVLSSRSIHTLADLTVRIPRLRGRCRHIPGPRRGERACH
jgi:hypothetical protein